MSGAQRAKTRLEQYHEFLDKLYKETPASEKLSRQRLRAFLRKRKKSDASVVKKAARKQRHSKKI